MYATYTVSGFLYIYLTGKVTDIEDVQLQIGVGVDIQ